MSTVIQPMNSVGLLEAEHAASFHADQPHADQLPSKLRKRLPSKKPTAQKSRNAIERNSVFFDPDLRLNLRDDNVEAYDPNEWY